MTYLRSGYVLKVRDLNKCRTFYRDILQLGSPLTDSNFRTEFEIGKNSRLVLCQARAEEKFMPESHSAVYLVPEEPEQVMDILASCGYLPQCDGLDLLYPDIRCYHDPEGNLIYLILSEKKG